MKPVSRNLAALVLAPAFGEKLASAFGNEWLTETSKRKSRLAPAFEKRSENYYYFRSLRLRTKAKPARNNVATAGSGTANGASEATLMVIPSITPAVVLCQIGALV